MSKNKRLIGLLLIGFCAGVAFLFSGFNTQSRETQEETRREVDTSKFPIVDLLQPLPTDPKEREKRLAKSKKHNNKYGAKIELINGIYVVNHSLPNLPALPIEYSSAIILGEVKDAKAYLSEDGTTVYSEFAVSIQSVLKNNTLKDLYINGSLDVERYGGRVRLPSGKIVVAAIDHQDMPGIGRKYVLFLTGGKDEAFTILTGYELRGGKVFPLDAASPTHPMNQYKLRDESTLLNDLLSALAASAERG